MLMLTSGILFFCFLCFFCNRRRPSPLVLSIVLVLGAGCRATPNPAPPRPPLPVDSTYQEGNRLYLQGEFASAAAQFEKYLAAEPKSAWAADAAYRIALCRTSLGEYGPAGGALDRAEKCNPEPMLAAWIRVARGDVAFGIADYHAAAILFDKALREGGDQIERDSVLYRAGLSRVRGGDWPGGRKILQEQLARQFPKSRWTELAQRVEEADGSFWIQVGVYSTTGRAEEKLHALSAKGITGEMRTVQASSTAPGKNGAAAEVRLSTRYVVRVGPYPSWAAASANVPRLKVAGFETMVAP